MKMLDYKDKIDIAQELRELRSLLAREEIRFVESTLYMEAVMYRPLKVVIVNPDKVTYNTIQSIKRNVAAGFFAGT